MRREFGSSALKRISTLEKKSGKLSVQQRILLAEIGTVEQTLSILVCSPVSVHVSRQTETESTILREVILTEKTGRPLIRANSKVYKQNLPADIIEEIRKANLGIGTILSQKNFETFRKIVRIGRDLSGAPYRIYRIIHAGKIAFEIRETILM
ncbi:MAG: hypothetical protein DA330_03200 [Nitrososphaera sp.]|nr:hypothetical protein [Nitrososphaera sp.]